MSLEENKATVRRFIEEGFNKNNPAVGDELVSPDFALIQGDTVTRRGLDGFKQVLAAVHVRFADFTDTIEEIVAEGDRVVVRSTRSAFHQGDYPSPLGIIAPTGNKATWAVIQIYRISDRKVAEMRYLVDEVSLLRQLGAIK